MSTNPLMTIFFFFLLLAVSSQSAKRLSLDTDLCKVSDFQALCRGTIKGQTNVNAATNVAIRELSKRTKQAVETAKKEVKREGGGVEICLSNFDNALYNLEKALKNIKENDGFSLNVNLSAALTDYDTCSDAMKEIKEISVVYKVAGVLYQMADNCLALSTLVKY